MTKKKKYYVVWVGAKPGIYQNWEDCQAQIMGYPQAKYKSFKTLAEAKDALAGKPSDFQNSKESKSKKKTPLNHEGVNWKSISVDAACSGNPGVLEYRGVHTKSGEEIFRQGPFQKGTNNIGEFLALVHALALLKKKGAHQMPIYSDSRTAMAWLRNKKLKTTLQRSPDNATLFNLVDRALSWLDSNSYENPILKWETEKWGEIPADFGRK
ncbi:MAG: ribonuclease H [Saprospiraceae bacterium]|nr:ribonuclease H [Saprospiraceae bacterium]